MDRPLIQWAADEAIAAGADTLVFVVNRNKRAINDHFDMAFELEARLESSGKTEHLRMVRETLPAHVRPVFVLQPEARGLGHAVLCARPAVASGPFGIILPDDFILNRDGPGALAQMAQVQAEHGGSVIAVEPVEWKDTSRYGIVSGTPVDSQLMKIDSIVEKPRPDVAPSNLGVVGRYVLDHRIFDLLENTKPGAGGEIQLTDAIAALLTEQDAFAYRFDGVRYDCGNKLGFVQATLRCALDDEEIGADLRRTLEGWLRAAGPEPASARKASDGVATQR